MTENKVEPDGEVCDFNMLQIKKKSDQQISNVWRDSAEGILGKSMFFFNLITIFYRNSHALVKRNSLTTGFQRLPCWMISTGKAKT